MREASAGGPGVQRLLCPSVSAEPSAILGGERATHVQATRRGMEMSSFRPNALEKLFGKLIRVWSESETSVFYFFIPGL